MSTTPLRNNMEVTSENSRDDYDGFDENLDTYDLDVPNSEIKTKTQWPVCRSYCW